MLKYRRLLPPLNVNPFKQTFNLEGIAGSPAPVTKVTVEVPASQPDRVLLTYVLPVKPTRPQHHFRIPTTITPTLTPTPKPMLFEPFPLPPYKQLEDTLRAQAQPPVSVTVAYNPQDMGAGSPVAVSCRQPTVAGSAKGTLYQKDFASSYDLTVAGEMVKMDGSSIMGFFHKILGTEGTEVGKIAGILHAVSSELAGKMAHFEDAPRLNLLGLVTYLRAAQKANPEPPLKLYTLFSNAIQLERPPF